MGSFLFQSDMSHVEGGLFPFNTSTHLPLPPPPPPPNTYKAATNPSSLDYKVPSFRNVPEIQEMEGSGDAKKVALSKKKELQQLTMEDEGGRTSKGVYLTWKDLRVTASSGKGGVRAYVTQEDILMTTLTVREAVYYSAQLQLPDSMPLSEKKARAEMTIKEMGLQDVMDTRIGRWSSKGLSGGQKRRVSICIEILTRPMLLFLDEPTSGLDSAASFHVMRRIVGLSQQGGRTVIASIHQPSSEVFALFHNLCLLSVGRTIYFGPVSNANEFFAVNGFPCSPMSNPSDHYLRTINTDFDQVGGALGRKGSQAGFLTQSLVLTRRSFLNMSRDIGYYWLRLAIFISLSLCIGTIYHDIGNNYGSIQVRCQARCLMLMFEATLLTFLSVSGFPSFVEEMKIFEQERLNGHYGVGAFVVGNTLSSLPYMLIISVVPGVISYYIAGLQNGIDHFVYFVLMLFLCMMLVESLMMIVASFVPDFLVGIITGSGIQGLMMLNGGFFRLRDDLPKPIWRYPMYYIAFHKYANQGLYKNEFIGLTFPNNKPGGPPITGEEILTTDWQVEMGYSKWVDLAIMLGMMVLYRLMFFGIIKAIENAKSHHKNNAIVPKEQSKQIMDKLSVL
ncbi:ABC transporter G family member 11-like protein [Cinnamomum micranthum f. kanehirae]|uniref:ABC transporter G family member 11-like protein n=1 Tax=Cinnamomum micranthum f. kanehirae TaxID=337451 RepID=A0A443P8N0_9MAGN|nr:ABC transporter G family member 11-like protein [Cinnamomum micranthum f. kanehirae]